MIRKIIQIGKKALEPPDMGGDAIAQFQADFLNVVLKFGLLCLLLLVTIDLDSDSPQISTLVVDSLILASGLVLWRWLMLGKIRRVGLGICVAGITLVSGVLLTLGSVRNGASSYLVLFVLVASVLFGFRGLVLTVAANSAIIFGVILAQKNGLLPPPNNFASFNQWQMLTALYVMVGWFAHFSRSRTTRALESAVKESGERKRYAQELELARDELAETNRELAKHKENLEELVHERTLELAAARDRAESAGRAKSAFFSAVSHEMKTPLNHIAGMSHLLQKSEPDEGKRQKIDAIAGASGQLDKLVSNILDYTHAESMNLELERREFTLGTVLAAAEGAVGDAAEANGTTLDHVIAPGLPSSFVGDPRRIAQVLEILLDNAVKFSGRKVVTVRVGPAGGDAAIPVLRFEVEDRGAGFPPAQFEELSVAFRQGEGGLTRRFGGVGLGLALARRLVALMAGEIGATSTEGAGSTFWFTLPLPAGHADGAA